MATTRRQWQVKSGFTAAEMIRQGDPIRLIDDHPLLPTMEPTYEKHRNAHILQMSGVQ